MSFSASRVQVFCQRLTKADRAILIAQNTDVGLEETRRKVNELEKQFSRFVPLVANELTEKFFKPLLASTIDLPPEMEVKPEPDPLDIRGFVEELKRGETEANRLSSSGGK